MNVKNLLRFSAVAAGMLSCHALASASVVPAILTADHEFTAPAPRTVVAPTALPRRYVNETVRVALTIDEQGRAHHVRLAAGRDEALARELLPAVAQWQFKPAMKNGRAVAVDVILPVELAEG